MSDGDGRFEGEREENGADREHEQGDTYDLFEGDHGDAEGEGIVQDWTELRRELGDPEALGLEAAASEDLDADAEAERIELSEREQAQRRLLDETDWRAEADAVFDELLLRLGEGSPQPRLHATRRAVELLGDVHRSAPVIQLTGTNGKTSTARIIAALLGAHGLRAGLLTSPHLERLNERIVIDGEPISDERLAANWQDTKPILTIVDAELQQAGEPALTFFEALTVLAFASFADAPVDVTVLEVGLGGEWDSTNVADAEVAVFTPIGLDHVEKLGGTLAAIARTKAGIIKPAARVVSAAQAPEALAELAAAAELREASLAVEGRDFALLANEPEGSAARAIEVRGLAGRYQGLLPLRGAHQGQNAAVAIAAVEAFFGGQPLVPEVVEQGLVAATSPGRLQRIGQTPPLFIDAAHNPHGAAALARAVPTAIPHSRLVVVLGVLADKDAEGIVRALAPVADTFLAVSSDSPRALSADDLAAGIARWTGQIVEAYERLDEALYRARELAEVPGGAVLTTGSITLLGEAIRIARDEGWGSIRD